MLQICSSMIILKNNSLNNGYKGALAQYNAKIYEKESFSMQEFKNI